MLKVFKPRQNKCFSWLADMAEDPSLSRRDSKTAPPAHLGPSQVKMNASQIHH